MNRQQTHVKYSGANKRPAEEIIAGLVLRMFPEKERPVLIAVGGPGGTGKSTVSDALSKALPGAGVLALDDYKTPREERGKRKIYGPHPEANRIELILEHLGEMRKGRAISRPVYDRVKGAAETTVKAGPYDYIILDGEISTYPVFRKHVDLSIFVDSDWTTQLNARIVRDIEQRGYSREKVIATFLHSNLREFTRYGAESKKWADIHVYCRDDFSHIVESVSTGIYENFAPLLKEDLERVIIRGGAVPVPTPFAGNGAIDNEAFIKHLEYLSVLGVGKVVTGSLFGEGYSLSADERRTLFKLARRFFPGIVLYCAGGRGAGEVNRDACWAMEYGADAVVIPEAPEVGGATPEGKEAFLVEAIKGIKDGVFVGKGVEIRDIDAPENMIILDPAKNYSPDIPLVYAEDGSFLLSMSEARLPGIAGVKFLLSGEVEGYPFRVRPPLGKLSAEDRQVLETAMI